MHEQSTHLNQLQRLALRSRSCLHCSLQLWCQLTGTCLTCWKGDAGHPQGLWLPWLLALHQWDCSYISMGTLLAAVKISLSRSLEASHTFWSPQQCNQLDLPLSRHNDNLVSQGAILVSRLAAFVWDDSHKWVQLRATWFTLLKARVFRIEVWLLVSRKLLFWHIVCMKAASRHVFPILQYWYYACF